MVIAKIKKRDGRIVDFDQDRIKNAVHKAFLAVELEDGARAENVTKEVVGLLEEEFREKTPSVEDIQDRVVEVLKKRGYEKVAQEYQDFRKKKEELRVLREKLGIEPKLTVNALEVLKARYLLRDEKENIIETPTLLFERVAKAIAKVDETFGESSEKSARVFNEMMTKLEFIPNTPTLFNAGTDIGQLSACFVLPVGDSLESIFTTVKNMALIEQTGGGVGFDFSRLRPKGDIVRSTKGVASGPVSFMRIFDTATEVIKAGGKRRGAMMGILQVDHPDVLEFITAKQNPLFLSNFNVSVAVTDEFMQKVESDEEYWLINPRNKEKVKQLKAKEVWSLMARSAWASGDPGVVFIDEINRHNPTPEIGKIESTNPCAEQPLLPYESCNLGSINLSRIVEDGEISWEKLRETVRNAVHFLDNVVDANVYPLKETADITRANRKIGLGVMGFADMLIMLGAPYDSEEALKIGEQVMQFIEEEAHQKSMEIGEERGSFPNFEKSIWKDKYSAFRNATVTTVAPTGTISIIAGCSSGIEPLFAVSFMRNVLGGARLFETNALFEETAKARGFYSAKLLEEIARTGSVQKIDGVPEDVKRLFVTALDIDPVWHIRMQAAFQKSTDNAVSKCLNKDQLLDTSSGILTIEKCGNATGTDKFGRVLDGLKVRDSSEIQRSVLSHYSAGLASATKITLWNGASIEGAKRTHRICTVDGWKTLGEITTTDLVKVKRRFIPFENTGSKNLAPLGDLKTNANEIAVPTKMTPELAKWLGMIAADSCCNERGGRVGIAVGQGKKEAKTLFKGLTLQLFNKHTTVVPDGRRPSTESVFIRSRPLCRWVFGLIGKSSGDRKVPEPVLEGSRAERMAFVEGLTLDGYYKEGHGLVVYEGRSQRLAYEVSEILRAEGKPRVTIHRKKDSYGITTGVCISNELQASFKAIEDHKNKEIIHKDQLVEIDPREAEKLKLPINDYRYSNLRSLKQTKRRYCWERVAKELGLTILSEVERVRSCEDTGLKEMYDVEVEGSHEYVVNGIVSHNTVNLPNEAKVEDVREIYGLAWRLKCKGVTVFRYGSKPEQVLYIGEIKTKEGTFVSVQSEYAGGCPTMNCPFPA